MRGRYRGGRGRGSYGERRRESQGRQEYQRGYPEGGWGDEREWEGMSGRGGSMGGYQGQGGRGRGGWQGGQGYEGGYQGYESEGYQGGRSRGGYQGGYGRSTQGGRQYDEGEYGDSYETGGYQGGYGEGEYGRQGRWGSRTERSFPGSSSFGGGSGGYGRGYEGEESDRYSDGYSQGEGSYGRGTSGQGQGSYTQGGRGGMGGSGQQRGPYTGRGPKGYQRSDERVREDVSEALSRHPDVDASEITVEVRGGEVILTGTVDSREAKREAERAIENEPGVKEVQNQLRVQEKRAESQSHGSELSTSGRSGVPSADQQAESRGRSRSTSSSSVGANV